MRSECAVRAVAASSSDFRVPRRGVTAQRLRNSRRGKRLRRIDNGQISEAGRSIRRVFLYKKGKNNVM